MRRFRSGLLSSIHTISGYTFLEEELYSRRERFGFNGYQIRWFFHWQEPVRTRNARVSESKDLVKKAQEMAKRQDSGVYGEHVADHALMAEKCCNI